MDELRIKYTLKYKEFKSQMALKYTRCYTWLQSEHTE